MPNKITKSTTTKKGGSKKTTTKKGGSKKTTNLKTFQKDGKNKHKGGG